eukprot:629339-Rhodomonas_salina.1
MPLLAAPVGRPVPLCNARNTPSKGATFGFRPRSPLPRDFGCSPCSPHCSPNHQRYARQTRAKD